MLFLKCRRIEKKKEGKGKEMKGKRKKTKTKQQSIFFSPRFWSHHHQWWQLANHLSPPKHWAPDPQPLREETGRKEKVREKFCQESLEGTTMEVAEFLPLKIQSPEASLTSPRFKCPGNFSMWNPKHTICNFNWCPLSLIRWNVPFEITVTDTCHFWSALR